MSKMRKEENSLEYLEVPSIFDIGVAPPPTIDLREITLGSGSAILEEMARVIPVEVDEVAKCDRPLTLEVVERDGSWYIEYKSYRINFFKDRPTIDDRKTWEEIIDKGYFERFERTSEDDWEGRVVQKPIEVGTTHCACGAYQGGCQRVKIGAR